MTMDNQAVDEILVSHCIHRRNHNAVEGRVARNDKLVGLFTGAEDGKRFRQLS